MNKEKNKNALQIQAELEMKIKNLCETNASAEELQNAYDEFHIFLLKYGVRGKSPQNFIYKDTLSPLDNMFLKKVGHGNSILEIGLGDGYFLLECAKRGKNRTSGIDISKVAVQRSKDLFEKEGISAEIKFGHAKSLAFADEMFDFVVSKDLVEHLPEADLQPHLREAWRVLKSGGCYLIWTPSRLLGHTSLGTHIKEYNIAEILKELKKAKFRPLVMSLPIFFASGKIIDLSDSHLLSVIVAYERVLERLLNAFRLQIQHPAKYLIVPAICISANKSSDGTKNA